MPLRLERVSSVLVFVSDWIAAGHWWAAMTGQAVGRLPGATYVRLGDVELIFRPLDGRNPIGGSPVGYWWVAGFEETRELLRDWGCVELHYPLEIPGDRQITQFRDPFGTIFGIEGPVLPDRPVWPEARVEVDELRRALIVRSGG